MKTYDTQFYNLLGGAKVPESKHPMFKRDKASCGPILGDIEDQSILDASVLYPRFNVGKLHNVDGNSTLPKQHSALLFESCKALKQLSY